MIDDDTETRRAARRPRLRFTTQVLILQLLVVTVVVALTSAVFFRIAVHRLETSAEDTALAIAQSVASDSDVRAEVARASGSSEPASAPELAAGPLQAAATGAERRTGALFVVITDDAGVRLAHPEVDRLGELVSTSPAAALRGEETVSWDRGTLGESARAKVPVYAVGAGPTARPVGEVSVGFARARVYDSLLADSLPLAGAAALALALGVVASVLIRRRLDRLTLGLQPEELVTLVQNQQAVLGGVGEGVLAVSRERRVTICNEQASKLLGLTEPTARILDDLGLPKEFVDAFDHPGSSSTLVIGRHVLFADVRSVRHDGRDLGTVAVVRDRTAVEALTRRLDAVGTMTTALRAQRHEFANRLHALGGFLDLGRTDQARAYLADVLDHGPLRYPVKHSDRLTEPYLQAFLGAKGVEAAERGVLLKLGPETLVTGTVSEPGDVTTVLGNLVDNAVAAAVAGTVSPAWVEVEVLDDGADLYLSVVDSGTGIADESRLFLRRPADETDDARIHGLGFGLPLSREIARRAGGDVWLASPGGSPGSDGGLDSGGVVDSGSSTGPTGAVFCARLVGAVTPAAAPRPSAAASATPPAGRAAR